MSGNGWYYDYTLGWADPRSYSRKESQGQIYDSPTPSVPRQTRQPAVSQPTETHEEQAIREKMYSVKLELIHFFQNILMKDVNVRECSVLKCNINADDFYFDSTGHYGYNIVTSYPTVTLDEWMSIYDRICGGHYTRDPQNKKNYKCNDTQNYINANMYTNVYGETKYLFRMISAIVNEENQYGNINRKQWEQFFSRVTQRSVVNIMDFIIFFKENISLIPGERGGGKKSNRRRHKSRKTNKKNRKTKRRSH